MFRQHALPLVIAGGFALGVTGLACAASPADPSPTDPGAGDPACDVPTTVAGTFVIQGVTVLSFDDGVPRADRSVLVRDGRIAEVGAEAAVAVPADATVVPGCGRVLVPGLADMHVHLSRPDLPAYLAAGVTTVRNLWGFTDLLAMQAESDAGTLAAPTIYAISSGLDGTPAKWPFTQFVLDPADADSVVAAQASLGYTSLKLYQDLTSPAFDAVIASAKARGLLFGGHVPHRVGVHRALESGYRFIEHLSGYEVELGASGQRGAFAWQAIDESAIPALVDATVAAGTWNSPTLSIFTLIAGGNRTVVRNRQRMVKALFDAGAPLLIGTDSGIGRTAPGSSVHDEIEEFIAAGLTPLQALRIATVEAARFLGEEGEFGRVAPGMRADLLLVSANPLDQTAVLRDPIAVFAKGVRRR